MDTPLTVDHEKEALLIAGFSSVTILGAWGPTYTLKADNRDIINCFQHAGEQVVLIYSDYEQTIKGLLDRQSEFVGAMDMDWKDREKSQDQDS